uniref:CID domain-containing protein n=1 Tax=Trypanosoma vivax (strain Y486) TaxID=1055687 RepID=G0U756_TRYVY|nr:conserved hypothetical protein [Trypanosoma vivax Y486]
MNREKVFRRLDLVTSSAGSIISVATWCALHASSAEVILGAIDERMRHPSTSSEMRCSLLYVIHELLLTCAANGVHETTRRRLLMAASKMLPAAIQAVRLLDAPDSDEFERVLSKVMSWWSMLNIFPRAWIEQIGAKEIKTQFNEVEAGSSSMSAQLRHVANLISRYNEAKSVYQHALQTSSEAVQPALEEALERLAAVRAAVDDKLEGGASLATWLGTEQGVLEGNAQNAGPAHKGQGGEQDDILGSFF